MPNGLPRKWSYSLRFGREVYVTNGHIFICQDIAGVSPLPPDGVRELYEYVRDVFVQPTQVMFGVVDMVPDDHEYHGPHGVYLGKPYIDFLLQHIPEERLRFSFSGDLNLPVRIYRDEEPIGFLIRLISQEAKRNRIQSEADRLYSKACSYLWRYDFNKEDAKEKFVGRLAQAAMMGHAEAMWSLGITLSRGVLMPVDFISALVLAERSIELGHIPSVRLRNKIIEDMSPEEYRIAAARIAVGDLFVR